MLCALAHMLRTGRCVWAFWDCCVVAQGNLAPNGAIIKPSAATPSLLQHTGKAIVFENIEDLRSRVDSKDLDVDKTTVMVLKGCGPKGYPGTWLRAPMHTAPTHSCNPPQRALHVLHVHCKGGLIMGGV